MVRHGKWTTKGEAKSSMPMAGGGSRKRAAQETRLIAPQRFGGPLSTREQRPLKSSKAGWKESRTQFKRVCCLGLIKVGTTPSQDSPRLPNMGNTLAARRGKRKDRMPAIRRAEPLRGRLRLRGGLGHLEQ